jgi:hypothetical protein
LFDGGADVSLLLERQGYVWMGVREEGFRVGSISKVVCGDICGVNAGIGHCRAGLQLTDDDDGFALKMEGFTSRG